MGIKTGPINFGNYNILTKMTHTKLLVFYLNYKKMKDVHIQSIDQSIILCSQSNNHFLKCSLVILHLQNGHL